jgi:hypothetical protein
MLLPLFTKLTSIHLDNLSVANGRPARTYQRDTQYLKATGWPLADACRKGDRTGLVFWVRLDSKLVVIPEEEKR